MKNNEIKVDAFILGYKRDKNIPKVVRGLRKQSFVKDIYVFHNFPSKLKIKNVINIYSDKNFGCIARHGLAILSDSEYALFVDDDLELKTDFSMRFIKAIKKNPYSIIGLFGVNISQQENMKNIYRNGEHYKNYSFQRYVDIIKGRVHLTHKQNILNSFNFIINNKLKIDGLRKNDFIMDDLILNLATQIRTKHPSILIPCKESEMRELSAEHGAETLKNHYRNRSLLTKKFLNIGWIPRANKGLFLKDNIVNGGKKFLLDEIKRSIELKNLQHIKFCMRNIMMNDIPLLYLYNYAGLLIENDKKLQSKKWYYFIIKEDSSKSRKLAGLSYFHLGKMQLDEGKNKLALSLLKKCLVLIPSHKEAKKYKNKLSFKRGYC